MLMLDGALWVCVIPQWNEIETEGREGGREGEIERERRERGKVGERERERWINRERERERKKKIWSVRIRGG